LGVYPVICVELCGLGHALMRSEAIVMTPASYAAWYKGASAPPAGSGAAGGSAAAIKVFTTSGCSACHTFSAIPGATGKVGPPLTLANLKASATANHESLTAFIHQAITDPYKYLPPGYKAGVMPPTFATSIPSAELAGLVQYLASHAS
jgi:cytochrome c oxidase subunit 2